VVGLIEMAAKTGERAMSPFDAEQLSMTGDEAVELLHDEEPDTGVRCRLVPVMGSRHFRRGGRVIRSPRIFFEEMADFTDDLD
jgi:hypothetical protein